MAVNSALWGPSLPGKRVRLEPITPARARAMLAERPAPELPWEQGFPLDSLLDAVRKIVEADEAGEILGPFFAYVIIRTADGMAIGDAGFHGGPDQDGEVEIGYALVPNARGCGFASEAVSLLLSWVTAQPGVRDITARVRPGNASSERLLLRMNFRPDGRSGDFHRFVLIGWPM